MSYAHSLAELQDLLRRADLVKSWSHDVYPLKDSTHIDFRARIAIRTDTHAKPTGVDFADADLELTLEVGNGEGLDAVLLCNAEVVIEGINAQDEIFKFALHFDRHDPSQTATDLHAHYHWQMGGDRLGDQNFGTVLHLQGPRFPWHPLDPMLLIDFVLGHFHGEKRTELIDAAILPRYPHILYASQTSLVMPFFTALHEALTTHPFVATPYWPALCGRPD